MMHYSIASLALLPLVLGQRSLYQPCPILGPQFPPPIINASSPVLQATTALFTDAVQAYVDAGDGDFGPITPNTTSFSIAFFAGSNFIAGEDDLPYFLDYHHTANGNNSGVAADPRSVYALGSLTPLFTVYTALIELGDAAWGKSIVEYIPELAGGQDASSTDSSDRVPWSDVTLGALAGQLSGVAFTSDVCNITSCPRADFLDAISNEPPIYLPDTTPASSNAAFQLLALAIEASCRKPFADVLNERIIKPLDLHATGLLDGTTKLFRSGLDSTSIAVEPAALSAFSSTADMSVLGQAMLTSKLIKSAETRRWLKPTSSTSNLRNSVGRPWDTIYHSGGNATNATASITDIYTKSGSIGRYSSYFGLVPDYAVGFVILAVNDEGDAPDLNAYADLASYVLYGVDKLARGQANATLAGAYQTGSSSLELRIDEDLPGLEVTGLQINGTDGLAEIAGLAKIAPENVDIRLYPSIPSSLDPRGNVQVFQGVIQDASALVDAGTPTCTTWETLGQLKRDGIPIDRWIFTLGEDGITQTVEIPALSVKLERQ